MDRMNDEAWKEVREPLAPLIRAEDFDVLDQYYRLLGRLVEMKPPDPQKPPASYGAIDRLTSDVRGRTQNIRDMLSGYANLPSRVKWLGF
jgi:hypothetical protein